MFRFPLDNTARSASQRPICCGSGNALLLSGVLAALLLQGHAAVAAEVGYRLAAARHVHVAERPADNLPNIQYAGLTFDPQAEAEQAKSISEDIRGMHYATNGPIPQPAPQVAKVAMGISTPAAIEPLAPLAPIQVDDTLHMMRQHVAEYEPQPAMDNLAIADELHWMNNPPPSAQPRVSQDEVAGISGRIQGMHQPAAPEVRVVSQQVPEPSAAEASVAVAEPGPETVEGVPSYAGPHPVADQHSYYSLAPPCMGCPTGPCQSGATSVCGVHCGRPGAPCNATWANARQIPWSMFGPGEYVGPARPEHVSNYYLRVNDLLTLTFIESRTERTDRYRFGVGDRLQIEWIRGVSETDPTLDRELIVQPDGTISLPLIDYAMVAGKTIEEVQKELVKRYEDEGLREPMIVITPLETNTAIQDLLLAVVGRNVSAGQVQELVVTPEGTIQAAGIGSVYVQGLTLEELRAELEARYTSVYGPGLRVTPALTERATSYVFMGGEVVAPGRYTLEGPTTVMQAIALAGGWNNGGNLREVVVFRRDENWCLKATKINIRAPYYGKDPCPANDVWLRDNDLVVVPKTKVLTATDLIELYFTRGVYAVFPTNYVYNLNNGSTIIP